jgi:branched-subunit amino acid aminotransferase/4-amino-4-deoxychorismate lyase
MKAYKDAEGHVRLFRPDMNMARLNRSSARLGMPVSYTHTVNHIIIVLMC